MQVAQLHMRFLPEEDRILFLITTQDQGAINLLFTRRYIKQMIPHLIKGFKTDLSNAVFDDPKTKERVKETMIAHEHQAVVKDVNFKSQTQQEIKHTPLGSELM